MVRYLGRCVAFGCLLVACGEPTIDISSDEAMETSIAEVRSSLDPEMQMRFDTALTLVAMSDLSFGALMSGDIGAASVVNQAKGKLEGKTGEEVIHMADSIVAEQEAERRRQAEQEIAELEERKGAADEASEQLRAFTVDRSRFRMREGFIGPEPIIELTVTNGLDVAISRAYFVGTLQSEGRSVPWVRDDFNYQIAGGLEPGETVTWTLAPNRFSDWGAVDAPADAVLTVEVQRLDGPDGNPLFGGAAWDEEDQRRLDSLRSQYR